MKADASEPASAATPTSRGTRNVKIWLRPMMSDPDDDGRDDAPPASGRPRRQGPVDHAATPAIDSADQDRDRPEQPSDSDPPTGTSGGMERIERRADASTTTMKPTMATTRMRDDQQAARRPVDDVAFGVRSSRSGRTRRRARRRAG